MSGTLSGCQFGPDETEVTSQNKRKKAKADAESHNEPVGDPVGIGGGSPSSSSLTVAEVAPLLWRPGQEATWFHVPRDVRRLILHNTDNGSLLRLRLECRSMYHDATAVMQARAEKTFGSSDVKLIVLYEHLRVVHGSSGGEEWVAAGSVEWLHLRKQDLDAVDSKMIGKRSVYSIVGLVKAVLHRFESIDGMLQKVLKLKANRAAKEERKRQQPARRARLDRELESAGLDSIDAFPETVAEELGKYIRLGTGWNEARCVKVISRARSLRGAVSERAWTRFFKAEAESFLLGKSNVIATAAELERLDQIHEARRDRAKAIFRGCDRALFDLGEFMYLSNDASVSVSRARHIVASILSARSERQHEIQHVAAKLGLSAEEVNQSYSVRNFIRMDVGPGSTRAIALKEILLMALRRNDIALSYVGRFVDLLNDLSTLEASFVDVASVVKAEQTQLRNEMWRIAKRLGVVSYLECPEVHRYIGSEGNRSLALSGLLRRALVGLGVPADYLDEVWKWDCDTNALLPEEEAQIARYKAVCSGFLALTKFESSRSGYKSWEAPLSRFANMRNECISALTGQDDVEAFKLRWILLDAGMESEEENELD